MATWLYYHKDFPLHVTTPGHPERPDRARRTWAEVQATGWDKKATLVTPTALDRTFLPQVHSRDQIERVSQACSGERFLDADTPTCRRSEEIALLAAGAAVQAVDAVVGGKTKNAFCLIRPPGHHATDKKSMGFCLYNNVALAAAWAMSQHRLQRILIVDWDVHHGNGTQDIFYEDPRVCFFSAHRYPFYPGTGAADETGAGKGLGYTFNLPIAFGTPVEQYRAQFRTMLADAAKKIQPELVLVSAGFDAHQDDPIGSLDLSDADFVWLAKEVADVADTYCKGALVSLLEGGYNLDVLARCVIANLEVLSVR